MPRHKETKPALVKAPTPYTHAGAKKRARPAKAKAVLAEKPVPPRENDPREELIEVARITAHPDNPNTHPESQIVALMASWREYGQAKGSIVVNEEFVTLSGHGVVEAARRLGLSHVMARIVRGWSRGKQIGWMIADNSLGEQSTRDATKLRGLVADLSTIEAVDLSAVTGISARKLAAMFRPKVKKASDRADVAASAAIEAATQTVVVPFSILSTDLILAIVEAATAAGDDAAHVGEACALELKRRDRAEREPA